MTLIVNIHEAKTQFSKLINRIGSGEEVIIAKAGKPVAKLVPVKKAVENRLPGSAKGKVVIAKNFDEPLPDYILNEFEN